MLVTPYKAIQYRERRFRVYEEAPGFRPGPRVMTRAQARGSLWFPCVQVPCPACNKKPPKSTRLPIASGKQWGDAMDLIKRACPVHVDCRYRRGGDRIV